MTYFEYIKRNYDQSSQTIEIKNVDEHRVHNFVISVEEAKTLEELKDIIVYFFNPFPVDEESK